MRVTVLTENSISPSADYKLLLKAVHGLSLYIETEKNKILFDVGPDQSAFTNAGKLGIDLAEVDRVIISHGHNDHGGALRDFFAINDRASVYLHETAVSSIYSKKLTGVTVEIGLDRELIEEYRKRIRFIGESVTIGPGLNIYEGIEGNFPRPVTNGNLYRKIDGKIVPDDFRHELILSVTEEGKQFVFTGCSHSGIINMVEKAGKSEPDIPIIAVFGGFHLYSPGRNLNASDEYLTALIEELDKLNAVFYTGHCTGQHNFERIRTVLGDRLLPMNTGLTVHL